MIGILPFSASVQSRSFHCLIARTSLPSEERIPARKAAISIQKNVLRYIIPLLGGAGVGAKICRTSKRI